MDLYPVFVSNSNFLYGEESALLSVLHKPQKNLLRHLRLFFFYVCIDVTRLQATSQMRISPTWLNICTINHV